MSDDPANPPVPSGTTRGELAMLRLSGTHSSLDVASQGAHVCNWQPDGGEPVLFMSPKSHFLKGKAIRGGVPVIFPWFGKREDDPTAPQHGFGRIAGWKRTRGMVDQRGAAVAEFQLEDNDSTRKSWPFSFAAKLSVEGHTRLHITLEIKNTDSKPFTFGAGLHSYFCVSDIERIKILGLEDTHYIDQVAANEVRKQANEAITFDGELDRIYFDTAATCVILDPGKKRRIVIAKSGSKSTVVWNPWAGKAGSMADLGADNWRGMVCVETTNAGPDSITLAPLATHRLETTITVERIDSA